MSGPDAEKKPPAEKKPAEAPEGDLAMEDILASIRRILKEDTEGEPTAAPSAPPRDDVLLLDDSMMVAEPKQPTGPTTPQASRENSPSPVPAGTQTTTAAAATAATGSLATKPAPGAPAATSDEIRTPASAPARTLGPASAPGRLLAPEAAAATQASLGALVRTLVNERETLVHRGTEPHGPTIEEMVREELRPFLKAWLDQHLPTIVERVVRAEIDRVLGNSLS